MNLHLSDWALEGLNPDNSGRLGPALSLLHTARMDTSGYTCRLLLLSSLLLGVLGGDYLDPHCGGRQVIVHLFEWKWTDVALECERFLGPKAFCGVQVSPPNEHAIITSDAMRPWWERYQPVSYKLTSRSGNRGQFKDMVDRCRKVGVRIYVDAVVNHMAGLGRKGTGSAGSSFDSDTLSFPGVPYTRANFHHRSQCPSHDGNVNDYSNPNNVRNCYLVGLTDLDGSQTYVHDAVARYFNDLIDLGVAGFRIDAAKHMWPQDIAAIQAKTKDLPEGGRPFFYLEVIDRNDGVVKNSEYFSMGYVTEFRYCQKIKEAATDLGRLGGVVDYGWGMAPSDHAFVFVDNHDSQRSNQVLTYKSPAEYKRAVAFTLAYNYGFTRVMSSYGFSDYGEGPPHKADFTTEDVLVRADGSCGNGWICEHRWPAIANMVRFRNAVAGQGVDNWRYQAGVLTFNRGTKGFFAMGTSSFNVHVNTGLPPGEYCDLISDCKVKIKVGTSGLASISPASGEDPMVAIIAGGTEQVHLPDMPHPSTPQGTLPNTSLQETAMTPEGPQVPIEDFRRTIVLIQRNTMPGQDVFLRGGLDHKHTAGCTHDATTSACSIPIRHAMDGTTTHYAKANAWNVGDNFLDWYGAEAGQGSFHGQPAEGTAAFWSTNDKMDPGYSELNNLGPHYWIMDVEMDCARTLGGYFELKAVVSGDWEQDIATPRQCSGHGGATPPYPTSNHWARCGYRNVFHFNTGTCEITAL